MNSLISYCNILIQYYLNFTNFILSQWKYLHYRNLSYPDRDRNETLSISELMSRQMIYKNEYIYAV